MGFKDWLPGKRHLHDDFFGELEYYKSFFDKGFHSYSVKKHFKPLNLEVNITIWADKQGPGFWQRDYYKKIESSYNELLHGAMPMILSFLKSQKQDYSESTFISKFNLVEIYLPMDNDTGWELTFETSNSKTPILFVTFESFVANSVCYQ